jgi:hypothetical protein
VQTLHGYIQYAAIVPYLEPLQKCGPGLLEFGVAFTLRLTILECQLVERTLDWGFEVGVNLLKRFPSKRGP